MKISGDDTIVALSTPPGEGGLGVVRLSGKDAIRVADRLFRAGSGTRVRDQKTFTASYGHALSGSAVLDEALLLLMRSPKSYTREDVVELSLHGSPTVLKAVLDAALEAGARLAEPGEFTKRAFLNGRIDLVQAEAVLDLIRAKTDLARRWSLSRLEGRLSGKMREAKESLVSVLSHLEAAVDFPDDAPEARSLASLRGDLLNVGEGLRSLMSFSEISRIAQRGLTVVITGRPNVGKSSLMNCLLGHSRVIVTPHPGTTRDVVEDEIQIGGFPVRFLDTAGIHDTNHPIEREGIERSRKAQSVADLLLCVVDASAPLDSSDESMLENLRGRKKVIVLNKSDLPRQCDLLSLKRFSEDNATLELSCITGHGLRLLENEILRFITQGNFEIPEEAWVYSSRQKDLIRRIGEDLGRAVQACDEGLSPEFAAVDVRSALAGLSEVVGEIVTDDVLDALFSQFCVGK